MFTLKLQFLRTLRSWVERLQHLRPSRLLLASGLVVGCTALMVGTVVVRSTERANDIVVAQQRLIMEHAVREQLDKVPHDQESVVIWDDALHNIRDTFNLKWISNNLGHWMTEYFQHDRTYLLDAQNRIIYAFIDGQEHIEPGDLGEPSLVQLTKKIRGKITNGGLDEYDAGNLRAVPRAVDLLMLDGRPARVSVMPIVSDTGEVAQERGKECLMISVAFLDGSFTMHLAEEHQLKDARFARTGDAPAGDLSFALRTENGDLIGYFVWTSPQPGWEILKSLVPVLAVGLLSIASTVAYLIFSLRNIHHQLLASEAQAKHLSLHDSLTGLPNRAYFDKYLDDALEAESETATAVLFLDLDRFKQVNDSLGHAAGDELIKQCASRLVAVLDGASSWLARAVMSSQSSVLIPMDVHGFMICAGRSSAASKVLSGWEARNPWLVSALASRWQIPTTTGAICAARLISRCTKPKATAACATSFSPEA